MVVLKIITSLIQLKDAITIIKDIFNILFFLVTGIITILTFIKAKKTILQPIKTEVFKQQLNIFSSIMAIFNGKTETEIRDFFAIDKLIVVNSVRLIDDYASLFFDFKVDIDERPYNRAECPSSIVTKEFMEKHFELISDTSSNEAAAAKETSAPDPMTRAVIWKNHKEGMIFIPKELSIAEKEIMKVMKSPLLPKECVEHLKSIIGITHKNIELLGKLLEEIAQELPELYPNKEELSKAEIDWIHNRFNRKIISYEPEAEKLINFLRAYLKVDELLE